jgi:hypothetical protein
MQSVLIIKNDETLEKLPMKGRFLIIDRAKKAAFWALKACLL